MMGSLKKKLNGTAFLLGEIWLNLLKNMEIKEKR
jgi:hypothetical protein